MKAIFLTICILLCLQHTAQANNLNLIIENPYFGDSTQARGGMASFYNPANVVYTDLLQPQMQMNYLKYTDELNTKNSATLYGLSFGLGTRISKKLSIGFQLKPMLSKLNTNYIKYQESGYFGAVALGLVLSNNLNIGISYFTKRSKNQNTSELDAKYDNFMSGFRYMDSEKKFTFAGYWKPQRANSNNKIYAGSLNFGVEYRGKYLGIFQNASYNYKNNLVERVFLESKRDLNDRFQLLTSHTGIKFWPHYRHMISLGIGISFANKRDKPSTEDEILFEDIIYSNSLRLDASYIFKASESLTTFEVGAAFYQNLQKIGSIDIDYAATKYKGFEVSTAISYAL